MNNDETKEMAINFRSAALADLTLPPAWRFSTFD